MSLQRRKTEMVGSLLVPTDVMVEATAGGTMPKATKETVNKTAGAVEQFKKDMKKTTTTTTDAPNSPSTTTKHMERTLWGETVDEVSTILR